VDSRQHHRQVDMDTEVVVVATADYMVDFDTEMVHSHCIEAVVVIAGRGPCLLHRKASVRNLSVLDMAVEYSSLECRKLASPESVKKNAHTKII